MNVAARPAVAIPTDPAVSDTLPGRVYTSEQNLALEKEKLFFRAWHYAGANRD